MAEAHHTTWPSNVVLVKKANGKWRMCVDYTDLNKAFPRDAYPLPNIDRLVDGVAGNKVLNFLDAYSGYNQIHSQPKSRRDDESKIKICRNRVWSRHHSYCRKLWKTIKKSKVCEKPDFGSGSRLRMGKVLAPHNIHPKTIPLIKCAKVMWFFKIFNFPQKY